MDAFILKLFGNPQQGWIDVQDENLSRIEFLKRLTTAKAATREIILIPGETTVIFLNQLAQQLMMDPVKLKKAYDRYAPYPEGSFVPETYSIPNVVDEEKLIVYLLGESEKKMKKWAEELQIPHNREKWLQIVTKASVIQKEASSVKDMPMVSSVIDNRLEKGMRLQMDGTLNYGEYSHQKITAKRIRSDKSPYNTYKNRGLPVYPVCNVSYDAVRAALHPAKTDYLYFVRGKDGEHVYTSYFSTHHKNIVNATK